MLYLPQTPNITLRGNRGAGGGADDEARKKANMAVSNGGEWCYSEMSCVEAVYEVPGRQLLTICYSNETTLYSMRSTFL